MSMSDAWLDPHPCLTLAEQLLEQAQQAVADGEKASDILSPYIEEEIVPHAPYVLSDNSGFSLVTPEMLVTMDTVGFRMHEDVVYHPDHWEPLGEDENPYDRRSDGRRVFSGHDGSVVSLTDEAVEWGRERHLWS